MPPRTKSKLPENMTLEGDSLIVEFKQPFDLKAYDLFIKIKQLPEQKLTYNEADDSYLVKCPSRFAHLLGIKHSIRDVSSLDFPEFLFPHQSDIIKLALKAKRFAVWAQMGLGKTLIEAEFARQVAHLLNGKVLIITLNEIVHQFIQEIARFYGDAYSVTHLKTQDELRSWCLDGGENQVAITNYEKMNPGDDLVITEMRHLSGIVLDESSRIKSDTGKQKQVLVKSCEGVPYKLSATATPAPNDLIEYASQASFLERIRSENDIIYSFFRRTFDKKWELKKHARKAFFEWMSGWSIYVKNPANYGWEGFTLPPEPEFIWHELESNQEQRQAVIDYQISLTDQLLLFGNDTQGIVGRSKLSQIGKGFIYSDKKTIPIASPKPGYIANLIKKESDTDQILVWTVFDEESTLIAEQLDKLGYSSYAVLSGKVAKPKRADIISRYLEGEIKCLISKPSLLGYGMNFQNCGAMVFSGWTDSFESVYQAIGRAVRFGQTKPVKIHLVYIPEFEGAQLQNVFRKMEQFNEVTEAQERQYIEAMKDLSLLEAV